MRCITSARYTMTATVLSQGGHDTTPESPFAAQDPDTGTINRAWVRDTDTLTANDQLRTIKCNARGIISKSTSGGGTSTKITAAGILDDTDYVLMDFSASEILSKRDRVTDIKNRKGDLLWVEEEHTLAPTVFQVMGVTPMLDPFGMHIANHAVLARAEVQ